MQSIDLSGITNTQAGTTYLFTFVTSGGSTQETVTLDSFFGPQTFVFDKAQLVSFSFAGVDINVGPQFDNVVLTTAAVPEPGTYALMLAGLSAIGLMVKRRKA